MRVLPCLLYAMMGLIPCMARADLWAFVDERGIAQFATEQLDARYEIFIRGNEFDSTQAAFGDVAHAGTPGMRPLAFFDVSPAYKRVKHYLRASASRHGVDYELLQALIVTESGFNAQAVSPKGAVGLMQLMPATAKRYGVTADANHSIEKKLTDPAINVPAGTRYLRYLLDLFPGRMDLALAAYNAGEGAVQRAGNQVPPYKETQNYVKTVLDLYARLKPPAPLLAHRAATARVRMELPAGGAYPRGNLPGPQTIAQTITQTATESNE